jgi:hypothetical protein
MSRGAAISPFPDQSNHIGSKDFPMPEKTHTGSCREAASLQLFARSRIRLELCRGQIAQGRVQSFFVVHLLQETAERTERIGQIVIFLPINLLLF